MLLRVYLVPFLGHKRLNTITNDTRLLSVRACVSVDESPREYL
jgi:hypothetical protein